MIEDFSIVTCCNRVPSEPYYCLNEFAKSVGRDRDKLIVLDERMGRWDGLGTKPKWLYKAITEKKVSAKYIIFCDCWDLVFSLSPTHLFQTYRTLFKSPLVISAEKNCFPADLKEQYDALPHSSSYRYLNSGMIVGETDAMLATLEAMDLSNVPDDYRKEDGGMYHVNDQFLYQQIFLKQPVWIELDYHQTLCNTLHSVKIEELDFIDSGKQKGMDEERGVIFNRETMSIPCSFHLNGSAKTDGLREPILKHINLI